MSMAILALIFAFIGAALNLFQPIANIPQLGEWSIATDISHFIANIDKFSNVFDFYDGLIIGLRLNPNLSSSDIMWFKVKFWFGFILTFCLHIAPIVAIYSSLSLLLSQRDSRRRKSAVSDLLFCAIVCITYYFVMDYGIEELLKNLGALSANMPHASFNLGELRQKVNEFISLEKILLWGILYAIATFLAYIYNENNDNDIKILTVSDSPLTDDSQQLFYEISKAQEIAPKSQIYEPIIGVETEALIKRALLFLEDGEFDNAERYLEQALNQDAENPRVYFAKLMLERKVHNVEELIEKSITPLDDEKLFQRALRFADNQYKAQLEFYARAVLKKLEQKREIDKEANYQKAIQQFEKSRSPFEIQEAINKLKSLGNYKNVSEWIEKAEKSLNEAQEKEEARKKFILSILGLIVICILGFMGVRSYINRAEQVAQEKERIAQEEAQRKLRLDAMTAFFEDRPDAEKLIKDIPGSSSITLFSRLLSGSGLQVLIKNPYAFII